MRTDCFFCRLHGGFVQSLACIALFSTVAAGCQQKEADKGEPPRIEAKGSVAPLQGVSISSPIDAAVSRVAVADGAQVHEGDVIATLQNPVVDRDVAYARAAVAEATAGRNRRQRAAPRPILPGGEAAAAAAVAAKEQKVERLRALLKSGDVARQDLSDAEAELAVARRDLALEQERMHPPAEVEQQGDPAMAKAQLDRALGDLAVAEHRQAQLRIVAPASGTVQNLHIRPGDELYVRDVVGEIVDASTVKIEAAIAPEWLRFLHPGQQVNVKIMSIPPRNFQEPITAVDQSGKGGAASIVVTVPNPDHLLQSGTPAVITVQ